MGFKSAFKGLSRLFRHDNCLEREFLTSCINLGTR